MLGLNPEEKVLMLVRRHWWVMVRPLVFFFVLLLIPGIAAYATALYAPDIQFDAALTQFLFFLYLMGLLLFAFVLWTNYYLDVWIITSERIIDINQKNLFSRVISEFPINRVQNVTIEIEGIIETMLKFGDLKVETAGRGEGFTIRDAPNLYEAKSIILRHSEANTAQP
ncbi:MAG: PH domain-containing protein [Candidatus Sungbacteria bacterium]|nr:PH domain-containing protein [Candidatus Sungbacteria bacterium]